MLHVWLAPVVAALAVGMAGFYLVIRLYGGSGVRTEGKTMVHKPMSEEDLPPS